MISNGTDEIRSAATGLLHPASGALVDHRDLEGTLFARRGA
jgi:hypothetical protein